MLLRPSSFSPLLVAALFVASTANAVSFDLEAAPTAQKERGSRCLSHWVPRDTFVKGTIKTPAVGNTAMDVEITDNSPATNEYYKKKDVTDAKFTFRTQAHADINICFHNILAEGVTPDSQYKRTVDLHFDFGAEAEDYTELAKKEKLKPMEVELRKLEKLIEEIVDEMEYLKRREARMRDTNESTNERVWSFSLLSIIVLCSVGAWQVFYLRKFFQSKKLI